MNILLLTRYSRMGASSRYRIWQYVPLFEQAGHSVEAWSLLDDHYLASLYQTGRRSLRPVLAGYLRRFASISRLGEFDLVICEQEAFPYLPALAETLIVRRSVRLILDYDDVAYARYLRWPILRKKIPFLMAGAEAVVAGSRHLADYARSFARRVHYIPTVINLAKYPNRQHAPGCDTVRMAWIDTPATAPFLELLRPVLAELSRRRSKVILRLIGAGRTFLGGGLPVESLVWSEESEAAQLAECDLGIMPLPDNEFTRGKCGLKLIQYMACGLPVIASPVGANCDIVAHKHSGLLARTTDDWVAAIQTLVGAPDVRRRMGLAGRARVAAEYCLEAGFQKWIEAIEGPRKIIPMTRDTAALACIQK